MSSSPPVDDNAKRAIASKKFALLRRIMADTSVSPIAFRLACHLIWTYRNEKKGGLCNPGAETLATDLGVNEKTIRRAVKELTGARYFRVESVGKRQSNRYWPIFDDRTQMSTHERTDERTEMSDHGDGDRTFEGAVAGHFRRDDRTQMSRESSLEPSVEPRARFYRAPDSFSTVDVEGNGETRLERASPAQRIVYRVDDDVDVPGVGLCTCTDDSAVTFIQVRHHDTGEFFEVEVLSDNALRVVEDTSWMDVPFDGDEDAA